MSLLWGYNPQKCDGDYCPNDCDRCYKADIEVRTLAVLERVSQSRANPIEDCGYPKCEECDKYHGHYCTVPIVVSKQIYLATEERLRKIENDLTELAIMVKDEIVGSKQHAYPDRERDDMNLTWEDYLGEDK